MKKRFILLITAIICLAFGLTLVACNDDEGGGGDGGKGTVYSIQAPAASDVYTVEGLPENACEGDAVKFKVTLANPAASIINSVGLSAAVTGDKTLTASADGSYSFVMPAESVRITVDADYYPDNETDNFLSWDDGNSYDIEIGQAGEAMLTANVIKTPSQSGGYFTQHNESAFSLNKDVVPDDALKVTYKDKDSVNSAISFIVHIDTAKVKAGAAKIVLVVENEHKFGDKAVLVCTVTVK